MYGYSWYEFLGQIQEPASYGSMSMFKQVQRMYALRNNVILGFDGEYSDFTYITKELDKIMFVTGLGSHL